MSKLVRMQDPNDALAWSELALIWAKLGQPLRAVRSQAESRAAAGDLNGAIDRLRWCAEAPVSAAAASIAVLAILLARRLPRFAATTSLSYTALLGSLLTLWRRYPALRRAAWAQGLLSAAFAAGPPSPLKPNVPVPANVLRMPLGVTLNTDWLPLSAT